jgi:ABC-2 type transport system ATP-binding protein
VGRERADTAAVIVALTDVGRSFGPVPALNDVSMEAPPGSITVLLGPNGAGKTTAIRLVTGALAPDRGTVRVFGRDPTGPAGEEVRRRCGVVTAKPSLYDRLSGWDNLRYAAELFGLGRGDRTDTRVAEAAERFGIADSLDQQVGGYSTGMKTRLALARAILHHPDLLLLDEPTSGLDPESANAVLELIRTMTDDGQTVVMCTHLLLEAEGLADQVVVMEQGTTVVSGVPDRLAARFWPQPIVRITAEDGTELDHLARMAEVIDYQREDNRATVTLDRADRVADLVLALSADGIRLGAVEPYRPSLEDLYFAVRRHHRASIPAPRGHASQPGTNHGSNPPDGPGTDDHGPVEHSTDDHRPIEHSTDDHRPDRTGTDDHGPVEHSTDPGSRPGITAPATQPVTPDPSLEHAS